MKDSMVQKMCNGHSIKNRTVWHVTFTWLVATQMLHRSVQVVMIYTNTPSFGEQQLRRYIRHCNYVWGVKSYEAVFLHDNLPCDTTPTYQVPSHCRVILHQPTKFCHCRVILHQPTKFCHCRVILHQPTKFCHCRVIIHQPTKFCH